MESYCRINGYIGSETFIVWVEIGLRYWIDEFRVMREVEFFYIAKAGYVVIWIRFPS